MTDTCLFHYAVGNMANANLSVNREISACDWAMPNIMIPLAAAYKMTAMFKQDLPDLLFVFRH